MAPSPDWPDYRRAVVSAQQLLASETTGATSVTVTLPPNAQTLVVACAGGASPTVTAIGTDSSTPYPGTQLKAGAGTGGSAVFMFNVAAATDDQVVVAVTGGPDWWVYADHARHAVEYGAGVKPAGVVILFTQDDGLEIWTVNPDGTGLAAISGAGTGWVWAVANPAGTQILAGKGDGSGPATGGLWVMSPDGSGASQITNITAGWDENSYATFSPDGSQFAIRYQSAGTEGICVGNADNSGFTNLPLGSAGTKINDTWPVWWSPDGTKFGFSAPFGSANPGIATCLIDGSGYTTFLAGTGVDGTSGVEYDPNGWYADSTNMLVGSINWTTFDLQALKSDGTTTTVLYDDPTGAQLGGFPMMPSPDGSQVALYVDTPQGGVGVLQGGVITTVVTPPPTSERDNIWFGPLG